MAAAKPQGQALRVLAHSQPCPFPPATLHLQVAKAERRSASGGAQTEKALPAETDIGRRNRALFAFTLLAGDRDRAFVSMKLKHVDLVTNCVSQDARKVTTKFSVRHDSAGLLAIKCR